MERGDIIIKLKHVKEALKEVQELPEGVFRRMHKKELEHAQQYLIGKLVEWTVNDAKEQ